DKYNNVIINNIAPDSIEVHEDYIRTGRNYTRTLVGVEFEPSLSLDRIKEISEISETITIVQYLNEYNKSEYKKDLSKSIRQNQTKLNEPKLSPAIKAQAEVEIEDARMMLQDLTRRNKRIFQFQFLIHIVAPSLSELDRITS